MESLADSILDFVRARQLNIAVAGVLTLVYFVYQYWGVLFKCQLDDDEDDCRHSPRLSRSRSRSRTRGGYYDDKHSRRKKRRCPDCSLCNFDQ